jgi:hypothetical protein
MASSSGGVDLAADAQTGVAEGHVALEALIMVLATVGVIALWREFLTARGLAAHLDVDLELSAFFLEDLLLPRTFIEQESGRAS